MLRVIIADDQSVFRKGLKQILENFDDVQVIGEAENGYDLLKLADSRPADLVFTDIRMPLIDGVKATEQLKRRHPHIIVIGFSAFETSDCICRMIAAGANGYLSKTRNNYDLLSEILSNPQKGFYISEGLEFETSDTSINIKNKKLMKTKKVIIVDDDIDVITIVEAILKKEGYIVISASDKTEGLKKIREEKPDLAILDVMMSTYYEGFELAKEIIESPELKSIPILMQTSIEVLITNNPQVQEMAREFRKNPGFKELHVICIKDLITQKAGIDYLSENGESIWFPVDGFIPKPVEAKSLLMELKRVLG